MRPTNKSQAVDQAITAHTGINRRASIESNSCAARGCTMIVHTGSFRNAISIREFKISGLCQACQDSIFLPSDDCSGECGPEIDRPNDRPADCFDYSPTDACSDEADPSEDIQTDRPEDDRPADPWKKYLLDDPSINADIISSNRAKRYRAKERQAQELYINSLIKAVPKERLNKETVDGIINAALKGW